MYYFLYPNKDTYIYEVDTNSEKNFGGDNTLVLKKDFDTNELNGVSRILLQFDLTELSSSIVSGDIINSKYYLRLYEQKTSELSSTYQLDTFPLSQSWEEGKGYTEQDPNSRDGVSWERSDESFDNTNWSLVDNTNADSGSRSVTGGGVWITGSGYECSQSFSYASPDVNMDVSDIVNNWLDSTISNNGLILKWSGSQENSSDITGNINFYSYDAHSIYSPKLEVRWDNHIASSGSNTGSLTPLYIDGAETKSVYPYMMRLRDTYRETEIPKFRVGSRDKYQTKSVSTTKSTTYTSYIPEGSGSYSIIDVATGETLIPFGSNSLLSCDSTSNYFKLKLKTFIVNRLYRIKLRIRLTDGRYKVFDNDYNFKVVN